MDLSTLPYIPTPWGNAQKVNESGNIDVLNTTAISSGTTNSVTISLFGEATVSGLTKTINLGTGGLAGSITDINIGSSTGIATINIRGDIYTGGNLTVGDGLSTSIIKFSTVGGTVNERWLYADTTLTTRIGFLANDKSWGSYCEGDGTFVSVKGYGRATHSTGCLIGSYNNVGINSYKTNPIYTIGSAYMPSDTALGNMYGIGYSHINFWGPNKTINWGLYCVSAGTIYSTNSSDGFWHQGTGKFGGNVTAGTITAITVGVNDVSGNVGFTMSFDNASKTLNFNYVGV